MGSTFKSSGKTRMGGVRHCTIRTDRATAPRKIRMVLGAMIRKMRGNATKLNKQTHMRIFVMVILYHGTENSLLFTKWHLSLLKCISSSYLHVVPCPSLGVGWLCLWILRIGSSTTCRVVANSRWQRRACRTACLQLHFARFAWNLIELDTENKMHFFFR